jgi:hypothetical protein
MSDFRLLLVEDDEQDSKTCADCVKDFMKEKSCIIDLVSCRTVEEAQSKLDNSYDAAIIDLKLAAEGNEGNQIVRSIIESNYRIPIAILTGTPDSADSGFDYIGVFKKGEENATYSNLLERFWEINKTGLTRIMGGRGIIENALSEVFHKNILKQKESWIKHGNDNPERTEKALLRHTLNHLLLMLREDNEKCYPIEFYISPPLNDQIHTGSIVKEISGEKYYSIMSPACDLAMHDGVYKTDRILVVEIEEFDKIIQIATRHFTDEEDKKVKRNRVLNNNYTMYYHCLPKTDLFKGGFINFRRVLSYKPTDFKAMFLSPDYQISHFFLKDILSRFSSYYARQGQPDVDYDSINQEA